LFILLSTRNRKERQRKAKDKKRVASRKLDYKYLYEEYVSKKTVSIRYCEGL